MEYNNSSRRILFPLIAAGIIILGILIGISLDRADVRNRLQSFVSPGTSSATDKLEDVLSLIRTQYVDDVEMDSIAEKVIPVLLENLDPHSVYIPAAELAQVNEPLEGQFDGIGVTFNMMTDTVLILSVIPGGPSARAGLLNGDRIITVDDSVIAGRNVDQNRVVKMLRGKRGSKVRLGIRRNGVEELLPVTVTRGIIPVKSIDAALLIAPGTGYIRLSRFSRNSHAELLEAVGRLSSEGMEKLIFDLRGNSGGFLDQAILIANEFLPERALIVYTEGKAQRRREQRSDGRGTLREMPVAVLIDESSASASEIVAGALQDNDRGTIVGRRSFGKGLVQEQIPFTDGSAVRLTVARYYTPVGRSIQKPYDRGIEAYYGDLENRFLHSELFSADSIRFPDSLRFTTPAGKIVYGGGGIMPDVFVPIDTARLTPYMQQVLGRNILLRYTFDYSDKHREALNAIRTPEQLDAYFRQAGDLTEDFLRYTAARGIVPGKAEKRISGPLLEAELKAYIGRNTPLEDNAFYLYIHPEDNVIKKTLEIF